MRSTGPEVRVAAGVLEDSGRVLVTRRPETAHQGGLWEFPGGKCEPGELPEQALVRELDEELGIRVQASEPLISIGHDYGDRRVRLVVRRVTRYQGEPRGREGQPLAWTAPEDLTALAMPAADRPVVSALRLPDRMAITRPRADQVLPSLERLLNQGIRWIQLRAPEVDATAWPDLAAEALARCRAEGARLVLNPPSGVLLTDLPPAEGLHLNGARLQALSDRPRGWAWVGASCHCPEDLARAAALGLDYAFLSPVRPTASHPGTAVLGWETFAAWVADAALPVYALGGVGPGDIPRVRRLGGQGIAGIGAFQKSQPKGRFV